MKSLISRDKTDLLLAILEYQLSSKAILERQQELARTEQEIISALEAMKRTSFSFHRWGVALKVSVVEVSGLKEIHVDEGIGSNL